MAFDFSRNEDDAPMAEINVTPLVDVMLVLLITFMITMPVLTHSIGLTLPTSAENAEPTKPPAIEPVRLAINHDGYFLHEKPVSLQELETYLRAEHQKNPDVVLAIAADKSLMYEKITDALFAAQQAGVGKIGFETEIDTP